MLGQAYALAIRRGHLWRAPFIRHLSEKGNERTGFFSEQEARAVISHLPTDLKDFVLFAYLCGWRKGSIASLRRIDVDLDAGEINLPGQLTFTRSSIEVCNIEQLNDMAYRTMSHGSFRGLDPFMEAMGTLEPVAYPSRR